jgi:hypothetical protein
MQELVSTFKQNTDSTGRRKTLKQAETRDKSNRLVVHGLTSFNLSDEHRTIFETLVCAWNDPLAVCAADETELLYQMMPCVNGPPKKR